MKPCECLDQYRVDRLNEQGISFNEWSMHVEGGAVFITNNTTRLRIPISRMKAFAEWYLEEQQPDKPAVCHCADNQGEAQQEVEADAVFRCPQCNREWDTDKYNACQCGAVRRKQREI